MDHFSVMFEHAVTVYGPPSSAQDASGGTVVTWPTVRQADVACLLQFTEATEQERFAQPGLIGHGSGVTYYAGLQRGDKLVVSRGPNLVGYTLHVTGIGRSPGVQFLGIDGISSFTGEFQE